MFLQFSVGWLIGLNAASFLYVMAERKEVRRKQKRRSTAMILTVTVKARECKC